MRTTLSIDDDVLAAAKHLAERDQMTIGEVISGLARRGLAPERKPAASAERNGVPLLQRRSEGIVVTPELVNQLRDESP